MKKAYLVSPAEPSGASWLLNCLLELRVKVGHKPCVDSIWRTSRPRPDSYHIWRRAREGWVLNREAEVLRKWLPACGRGREFAFRSDIAVEYVQDFPAGHHQDHPVVYFIRDPRDAMYSMFRRVNPEMSCLEFVSLPHPNTLLSRIDHWGLHVRAWMRHANVRFVRFEAYKRDPHGVLKEALDGLQVGADSESMAAAVSASTFEKAVAAEREYQHAYPNDKEVINRAGRVGDWNDRADIAESVRWIENRVPDMLEDWSYAPRCAVARGGERGLPEIGRFLEWYRTISAGSAGAWTFEGGGDDSIASILAFGERVDEDLLRKSRLRPDEVRTLLDSLGEFQRRYRGVVDERLGAMRAVFGEGAQYHLDRIRELRARRRKDP